KGCSFHEIRNKVKGYYIEAKTHSSIASAIRFSKADVGVGIRTVAIQYDLEFIPIREEKYDFLIKKDSLKKEAVKEFIKILKDEKFKDTLKIMGMNIPKNMGEIIFSR
ncbi:MAG: substrate-binding domain-containing protein, partial [Candidatus Methanomethylicia archaeon]